MHHQPLSSQAYAGQMVRDPMVVPLPHGSLAGVLIVRDVICADTIAASYTSDAAREARAVARAAEARKREKHALLFRS